MIAKTFSLGCFEIGTSRSRFSSTNRRTNTLGSKRNLLRNVFDNMGMARSGISSFCLRTKTMLQSAESGGGGGGGGGRYTT